MSATSALFEGLPEAPAPPAPDEPGGSLERYDPERWKPDHLELYDLRAKRTEETFFGYVTLQFAAELFDVQRDRLQMAISRGALPGKKVEYSHRPGKGGQGQWFVHPGHVARYLSTTLRGVTNRRKAEELGPVRAQRERERLLKAAALAETRAQELRDKIARLKGPEAQVERDDARARLNRQQMYAKNRRRMADALEHQQQEFGALPEQPAAAEA